MLSLFFHFFVTRWQHPLNTFAAVKSITVFLKKEMNKVFSFIALAFLGCGSAAAQQVNVSNVQRPKLVVGIVVDQMRWDYLYRYQKRYGEGGFKRLLNEGFSCENTRIPYVPSVTAIGHTSIWTGSVPSIHGIAGNNFVKDGKVVYCTADDTVNPVGSDSKAGKMSPRNLWVTTIGDELRLATNNRSKVIGVALKDRASILPAGHHANGAFWFDDKSGKFITSTFYMDKLPEWVNKFNKQKLPNKYLSKKWETLYPIDSYKESTSDDNNYENGIVEGEKAVLPLDLPTLYKKHGYKILRSTPFGCNLTFDIAKAAIEGENLGRNTDTDLLTISCSSTDYIGHQVGVNAIETEDCYLRLDKALADFFAYLDQTVGKGNYLTFLTADHGGVNNATFLQDQRIPAGIWNKKGLVDELNKSLKTKFNTDKDLVKTIMNYQVFFNTDIIEELGLDYAAIKQVVVDRLKKDKDVHYAFDMEKTSIESIPEELKFRAINGYNRERSGGVQIVLKPGHYDYYSSKGTTHGAWNPYDIHIPCLFMGWGIQHGESAQPHYMTDIAATVCAMLHIQAPNGCIGTPIF